MELKLYDIKESDEYKSLIDLGCNIDKYSKAADNTYNIINKKMLSDMNLHSFPSEIEFMCLAKDNRGNLIMISMLTYFKMLVEKDLKDVEIVEISPHLQVDEFKSDTLNMFKYNGVSIEEKVNKKLLWLCKVAERLQEVSTYRGITSDYKRLLVTEYMNDFSYSLYARFNLDLGMVCKILTTRETYINLDKAIEVIITGEALRKVGDKCELYNQVPKYKFVSTYIDSNMTVKEIIRIFSKHRKHLIHKSKLDEFIGGREVMIDFKNSNSPVMSVAFLDE